MYFRIEPLYYRRLMYSIQKSSLRVSELDVSTVKSYVVSQLDNYVGIANASATKKIKCQFRNVIKC